MEQPKKHKLMDTCASSSDIMVDRLSDLEEGLTHHILSFLNIRDVTRFGIVSKRCRQLHLSNPCLKFVEFLDTETFAGESFWSASCKIRLNLLNSLDRFLLQRGGNKIQCFRLKWERHFLDPESDEEGDETVCFCVNEHFRIITWIDNAVRCNVEVLHVETDLLHDFRVEQLVIPSCVFHCATLRSLVVEMTRAIVKTPSFVFYSNLTYLNLSTVEIEDERFFKWISCSCKFIKKLFLDSVCGIRNFTIESSSLENFKFSGGIFPPPCHLNISGEKLVHITINWGFDSPSDKSLNIFAPKLKSLCWSGNVMDHTNLGELESLEEASIRMNPEEAESNKLLEVFSSLESVEDLVVNEATIKALFKEGFLHARLDNLSYLRMNIKGFTDDLVLAVASLLKGMPNLCTLYISYRSVFERKSDVSATGFDMEYWKAQNLDFICQLQEATIELFGGSNEVELARYILEHAENLQKMVIIYLPEQSDVIEMINENKIISEAVVIFQPIYSRY